VATGIVACLLAVAVRGWHIHTAVRRIESQGGDVWCTDVLYSGYGYVYQPRSTFTLWRDRGIILCKIMTGTPSEIWACYVPDDRELFARTLNSLNPEKITFEVLGSNDLVWVKEVCQNARICAIDGPDRETEEMPDTVVNGEEHPPTAPIEEDGQSNIVETLEQIRARQSVVVEALEQISARHPKSTYRIGRYETVIGFPVNGEMGRLYDHHTGRVIYLPWPN